MIARSRSIAALSLAGALGLHAAGVLNASLDEPVKEEGGAGATIAALGASFEDMVTGTLAAEPPVDQAEEPSLDLTPPPQPEQLPEQPPQEVTQPVTPPRVVAAAPLPTPTLSVAPVPITPPQATTPQLTALPPPPTETIAAAPDDQSDGTISKRPPAKLPDRKPPEPVKAQPKKAPAEKPTKKAAKPKPKKQGNTAAKSAKRGSTTGQAGAKAAKQGKPKASKKKSGNASVSNYPGLVNRCVRRSAGSRVRGRGRAVVSFKISGNGRVTSVGLARSSGNAKLDRAALQAIKRAGPCPAPPPGARRSYSLTIKGR